MKNIYFVQANNTYGTKRKSVYIPYAIGCIIAYCRKNETIANTYKFNDIFYTRLPIEEILSKLDNPYMVLFSCSVWNTEYNKAVAKSIKQLFPHCYIVFGGHNISADGSDLKRYSYVDFLTHRFGEESTEGILESLANKRDMSTIPNISYRDNSGEVITTESKSQTGIDYPSPYLDGVFDQILNDDVDFSVIFETNRGCPNSCSYCDWGSLKSKVRLFPMERVKAELNWFVEHKIEFVFCADGNFCLFERDKEIADYVYQCKEKYGYPKIFRVCFTKNKLDQVFEIGSLFLKSGLDKAQTLSFQSMNPEVLKNIGRKNISTEKFRELMKKYNEVNMATFSELILGLPGETYDSFRDGVGSLIENGQHYSFNVYPCELLPNSEMGQKSYIEKYKISSTRVPFKPIHTNDDAAQDEIVEYGQYVTATYSMDNKDWVRSLIFSKYVQALHCLGLLRATAIFFRNEYGVSYSDFYNNFIEFSIKNKNTMLNKVYNQIKNLCYGVMSGKNGFVATCSSTGSILWDFDELIFLEFYEYLDKFYDESKKYVNQYYDDCETIDSLFAYQRNIIKKIGLRNVKIVSDYDFYNYFRKILLGRYESIEKIKTTILIKDDNPIDSFQEFAREVVWFGRNKRVSDYSSTNYKLEVKRG